MTATAVSFAEATDIADKFDTILDRAPVPVKARFAALKIEFRDSKGLAKAINDERVELLGERDSLNTRIGQTEREIRLLGTKPGKYVQQAPDEDGVTKRVFVEDKSVDKWKARIEEINVALSKEFKLKPNEPARVIDAVSRLSPNFRIELKDLRTLPETSASPDEAYKIDFKAMRELEKELASTRNRLRTREEMKANVAAEIDALADRGKIGPGGYARPLGEVRNPRLQWPQIELQSYLGVSVTTLDSAAVLANLFGDQLKEKIFADIDQEYNDFDTITDAEKVALIADLESRLWTQRHVTELRYRRAREFGTKLLRPKMTPVEILLGCKPF
jgi:hypothetical protein